MQDNVETIKQIMGKKWTVMAVSETKPGHYRAIVKEHKYTLETCAKHVRPYYLTALGWDYKAGFYMDMKEVRNETRNNNN